LNYVTEQTDLVGSTELSFRCTACDETHLLDALRFKTVDRLLHIVPIWITHETVLKCPGCDATYRSGVELELLQTLSEDQIAGHFKLRVGLVEKFLVIFGWLIIVTGPVSLFLFVVAWFVVPKAARGWRRAALIGMLASLVAWPITLLLLP